MRAAGRPRPLPERAIASSFARLLAAARCRAVSGDGAVAAAGDNMATARAAADGVVGGAVAPATTALPVASAGAAPGVAEIDELTRGITRVDAAAQAILRRMYATPCATHGWWPAPRRPPC